LFIVSHCTVCLKLSPLSQITKKKFKYKRYTGRVMAEDTVCKMTESLEQTEMNMLYEEYAAAQNYAATDRASGLLNMPVSCHSILKVRDKMCVNQHHINKYIE